MSVYNNATNTPKLLNDGEVLIGVAGNNPVAATLTAGDLISITNNAGQIIVSSFAAPAFTINQSGLQFTTPGTATYTPTAGTVYAFVQVLGGGGGGGGSTNTGANDVCCGTGGGGGGYTEAFIDISTIGSSQTITVGAGGIGVSSDDGTSGGDSSFGALLIGNGGSGGVFGGPGDGFDNGGSGGGYSGSSLIYGYAGQTGGSSGPPSGAGPDDVPPYTFSGSGGSCFTGRVNEGTTWGPTLGAVSIPGSSDTEFGVGGSGGLSAFTGGPTVGGDGFSGFVFVTEYLLI